MFPVISGPVTITKVGQWPALSRRVDRDVTQGWKREDIAHFQKAINLRHFGLGLGALPYLRQVVEKHLDEIFELLDYSNTQHALAGYSQERALEVRKSRSFSEKLGYIKDYLPPQILVKDAPNPLALLHTHLSAGIHNENDEECVRIFDRCREAFEYVIKRLSEAKRDQEKYRQALLNLNR